MHRHDDEPKEDATLSADWISSCTIRYESSDTHKLLACVEYTPGSLCATTFTWDACSYRKGLPIQNELLIHTSLTLLLLSSSIQLNYIQ